MCPQRLVCWGQVGPGCFHVSAPLGDVPVPGLVSQVSRSSFVATLSPDVSLQASGFTRAGDWALLLYCSLPLRLS